MEMTVYKSKDYLVKQYFVSFMNFSNKVLWPEDEYVRLLKIYISKLKSILLHSIVHESDRKSIKSIK